MQARIDGIDVKMPYSSQHLQEHEVPESPSDVKSRFHLSRVIRNELPPSGSF